MGAGWGNVFQNSPNDLSRVGTTGYGGSSNQWGALPSSNPQTGAVSLGSPTTPGPQGGTTITGGNGNAASTPQLPANPQGPVGNPYTSTYTGGLTNPSNPTQTVGGLPTLGASSSANSNQGSILSPLSPTLTQQYLEWLATQTGQGLPGYQGAVNLPSGGQTQPGQLTAQENPVLAQLQTFLSGGGSGGNAQLGALGQMAQTGDPTNTMPEWQAMVAAMQQPIQQGQAALQEQFGEAGGAQSSVYGNAMSNYYNQANAQEQSLLGQLTESSQEAALGREQTAQGQLLNANQGMGQYLQGLDQTAINNLLQNYYTTLPQYNPMNSELYGASTTFPSYVGKTFGESGVAPALGGAASALAGAIPGASSTPSTYPTSSF